MISVREADETDIVRIIEIVDDTVTPAWTYDYVRSRMHRDDTVLFVSQCSEANDISGFAALRQVGDDGELLLIAVDKAYRRSGIGSVLLDSVLKKAKDMELKSIFLEVRQSNTAALALYKKHGFEQIRVRKAYYDNPTEDAVILIVTVQA